MKLHHKALRYLSVFIFLIVSVWSVVFYINMLDEIYDSIDDGLDNYKLLIIQKAERDTSILKKNQFDESNYAIHEISKAKALKKVDVYSDTLMYMTYEDDLEPVRKLESAFEQNGRFYQLDVISSMVEEDDLIEDLFWAIFWLYLILISSIIVVNGWVLKKVWEPFYGMLQSLRTYKLGQSNKPFEVTTNINEFKDLHSAVQALINNNEKAFYTQKNFTENAAHELQTPIAIALNKAELLLENYNGDEATANQIAQILEVLERSARLNKTLLLLSKIENQQYVKHEELSVHLTIAALLEQFEPLAEYKSIEIHYTNTGNELYVNANQTLLEILLSNLIKNAINYSKAGSTVYITLNDTTLSISNTGEYALDFGKITARFYKNAEGHNNLGLGLSLVKAVVEQYHFLFQYQYKASQHIFSIKFR